VSVSYIGKYFCQGDRDLEIREEEATYQFHGWHGIDSIATGCNKWS